jgi:hypothetical protein
MTPQTKQTQHKQYFHAIRAENDGQMTSIVIPDGVGGYTKISMLQVSGCTVSLTEINKMMQRGDYV